MSLVVPQKVAQTGEDVAVVVEVDHGASQAVLQRPAVELEEPQHRAPDPGSEPRPHGEVRLINVASLHGQFRERHHDPRKQVEDNLCSRKQRAPVRNQRKLRYSSYRSSVSPSTIIREQFTVKI